MVSAKSNESHEIFCSGEVTVFPTEIALSKMQDLQCFHLESIKTI
jgi:hypothetical protein